MDGGVGDIDVRWRNFCTPSTRLLNLLHIPDTERRPTQLRPHTPPGFLLANYLAIGESLDVLDELAIDAADWESTGAVGPEMDEEAMEDDVLDTV